MSEKKAQKLVGNMFDKNKENVGSEYPKVPESRLKNFQLMKIFWGEYKSTIKILDKERLSSGQVIRRALYTVTVHTVDLGRQSRGIANKYRILRDAVEVIKGDS